MAAPIYVNSRMPERDQEVVTARASASVSDVAERYGLSKSSVTTICHRVREQKLYELKIERPGERATSVGTIITHKGFTEACIGAYRHYGDFFRGLDLPDWFLTDGNSSMTVETIREEIAHRAGKSLPGA
jgi:hypothetical protein